MSINVKKESTLAAASHYAIYLGLFWVFQYIFLMAGEYNDIYLYVYSILTIGTPILFYALACVYRDKRLGGNITFGKVVAFAILLFLLASFLEAVAVAINIIIVNPNYISDLQDKVFMFYENLGVSEQFLKTIENGFAIGPMSFIMTMVFGNVMLGLMLAIIFGYFISKQKPAN